MSIEFNNAYQEILLENVTAIIKQNFLLQTQLKLLEKNVEEKQVLQNELSVLKNDFLNVTRSLEDYERLKQTLVNYESLNAEKDRIQQALNSELQKNHELNSRLNHLNYNFEDITAKHLSITNQYESLLPEKDRIQQALNEELRKNKDLESQIAALKTKQQAKKSTVRPQIKDEHRSVIDRITPNTVLKTNVKEEKFVALKKNDGSSF